MRHLADERGLTLVELIVGSAAALLIFFAVAGVEISALRGQRTDSATFTMQAEATTALERMAVDVRQSSGFTVSGSSTVTVNAPGGPATYRLSGGKVQRVAGGVTRTLTSNVSTLQFSAEDGGKTLHVVLQYNLTGSHVYQLESRATVRVGQ